MNKENFGTKPGVRYKRLGELDSKNIHEFSQESRSTWTATLLTAMKLRVMATGATLSLLLMANSGWADVTVYSDPTAFTNDLAELGYTVELIDFESEIAGTTYSDPAVIGSLKLKNFDRSELIVTDEFATTSGKNYLGVANPDFANQFVGGLEFDLQVANRQAIGLFLVTGEIPGVTLFHNDVQLQIPKVGSAPLDVDANQGTVGGTDNVFFIGLIDKKQAFSDVHIRYDASAIGSMTFNIDDVLTALPFLLGDINRDGAVDLLDVDPFVELIFGGEFQAEADVNQDGTVDLMDVAPFIELVVG